MIEEGRSGKAPRVRRHQAARTPYARPPAAAGASTPAATPIREVETALDTQNKSSLLASVLNAATTPLRAAATLINKVPLLGGYFNHQTEVAVDRTTSPDDDGLAEREQEVAANSPSARQKSPIKPATAKENGNIASILTQDGPVFLSKPSSIEISFSAQLESPSHREANQHDETQMIESTPYDNVLHLLRTGPLGERTPLEFVPPMPTRSRTAAPNGVRLPRTQGQEQRSESMVKSIPGDHRMLFGPTTGPSALPPGRASPALPGTSGPDQVRLPAGVGYRRFGYTASRLGPFGGATVSGITAANGTGLVGSGRFGLRTQPSFGAGSIKGGSTPTVIPFSSAAAPMATRDAFPSPPPLAWTPLRSAPGSMFGRTAGVGSKRKAETATPGELGPPTSNGSQLSLLDAARRTRRKAEQGTPSLSTDRRSWRAGRTPYQPRSSYLGDTVARSGGAFGLHRSLLSGAGTGLTPVPSALAFGTTPEMATTCSKKTATPGSEGSKPTTDTAKRILETLDQMDETLKSGSKRKVSESTEHVHVPPPTESLGAGLVESGRAVKARKPRVTFGELTGVSPVPKAATEPAKKEKAAPSPAPTFRFTPMETRSAPPTEEMEGADEVERSGKKVDKEVVQHAKANGAEKLTEKPTAALYTFSAGDKELNKRIKAIVATAGQCSTPAPTFSFGQGKVEEKKEKAAEVKKDIFGIQTTQPFTKANLLAQEAAKSPLPAVDSEADEEEQREGIRPGTIQLAQRSTDEENREEAAPASTGWDLSFLQKTQAAAAAATEAVAKEIDSRSKPSIPSFTFGGSVSFAASAPVIAFGVTPATVSERELEAKAPTPESEQAAAPAQEAASGWGSAFLQANAAQAEAAAEAARKEAEASKPSVGATQFSFGAPVPAGPASTPAFKFSKESNAAPLPVPAFVPAGKPAEAPTAAEEEPEKPPPEKATPAATFQFGSIAPKIAEPVASTLAPSRPFPFGAEPTSGAFTFGATKPPDTAGAGVEEAKTSQGSGATAGFGSGFGVTSGFGFGFGGAPAQAGSVKEAPSASYGLGANPQPSAQAGISGGAPAPMEQNNNGGGVHPSKTGSAPAPTEPFRASTAPGSGGFGFQSSATSFGFSGTQFAPAATPVFGAAQSAAAATASGFGSGAAQSTLAFGFGATQSAPASGFGAAQSAPASGFGAAQSAPAFGFGAAQSAPAFGFGATQSAPASGFGATQSASAFGFGAAQSAPASGFGAAQSAPASGFGATQSAPAFGFGAAQSAPAPAFGFMAAQAPNPFATGQQPAPMGQMIPNPFGGPAPGGGFSIGSTGNSQSEGRRKVRVRRPGGRK